MKKLVIPILAMAAVATALWSCGEKTTELVNISGKASYKLDVPKELAMDQYGNYYSTAEVNILVPKDASEELKTTMMRAAFPEDTVATDWQAAVDKFLNTPVDYGQKNATKVESVPDSAFILSKTVEIDTVAKANDKISTYSIRQSGYMGGAHGYFTAAYINCSSNGNIITADKIFADSTGISKKIVAQLVKDFKVPTASQLMAQGMIFDVAAVRIPANFYPEKDKIVFYYNPYEIGPWSQGEIKVALPVTELLQGMTDYGKSLFKE